MASDAMKRNLLYILLALFPLLGCQREYAIYDELSVTNHTLNIGKTPGQTHIMVYSTGAWTVALERDVEWASLNKTSGEGLSDFVLSWSANYGVARHIDVLVSRGEKTERIHVVQAGTITAPYIVLDRSKVVLPRQETALTVGMNTNLGISLDEFRAKAVYASGDTLEVGSASEEAWIKSCRIAETEVEFTVAANSGSEDRTAVLMVYMIDSAGQQTWGELSIVQTASDPVFTLQDQSGDYYANAEAHVVPAESNNIWSLPGVTVTADADWITGMGVQEEGLAFSTEENTSGASRSATVTVAFRSQDGYETGATYAVTQGIGKFISFSELRSHVPGRVSGNEFLEGFIVSDPESPNVCSSPQTGQYAFDRTENDRTAYMESTDGSLGVCIKFTDAQENTIPRWSKVHLRLDGTTLLRESSPLRFTIKGVTASMFTVLEGEGGKDAVPVKEMSIARLTDADVFTYVSLKEVEILCKDGAYTNASEGYSLLDDLNPSGSLAPRWDVAPLLCTDTAGDGIFMLTNAAAPWRRTGEDIFWNNCVKQGSGTLSGIIVGDDVAPVRWGNLGRYQLRPMTVEEIALDEPMFSSTICEWNWNDFEESFGADEGQGTLRRFNAASSFVEDYNNPFLPKGDKPNGNSNSENLKGLVKGAALCLTQNWWDAGLGQGKYFEVEFSTVGISGTNLIFGIVWGHGLGTSTSIAAPSHWNVLYSTDGNNFASVPSVSMIRQRSIAWWKDPQTSQDGCPGYTEHLIKLPTSCFGQSKVIVRLQAADDVTDIAPFTSPTAWKQALGIEHGTLSSEDSGHVRIGTITVRYN